MKEIEKKGTMERVSCEPVRVLVLNSGSVNYGGVSSFLFNIYKHLNKNYVQFDFLSPAKTTYGIHKNDIESLGGQIFEFNIEGNIFTRKMKLYKRLRNFLRTNNYSIVHINSGNFFFNLFALSAVEKADVSTRIVHSHNAGDLNKNFIKNLAFQLLKPLLEKKATHLFACSEKAAKYMFTKNSVASGRISIIPNGIFADKFKFSDCIRREVRGEFALTDKFVVGHVGRFVNQKNHSFLIEIFDKVYQKNPNAVLLLLGEGELQPEIEKKVQSLGLGLQVLFLGVRNDVQRIYQAMDVFVLPSFHEGLPVTGIEVQVSGLPAIFSDSITSEIKITKNVTFMSLSDPPGRWANRILEFKDAIREDCSQEIVLAGYDVQMVAKKMESFYLSCFEEKLKK